MQFYKSLTEQQRGKICLAVDDPRRQFVSNWWYVCPDQRLHNFYSKEQRDLVRQIFESLHHPDHREKMNWQVQKDLMGNIKNTPSVGFFGTPADKDFEFIYTGHHVTRRCNAHTDKGLGFGGAPIFYGNFAKAFNELLVPVFNAFTNVGITQAQSSLDQHWACIAVVSAEGVEDMATKRCTTFFIQQRGALDQHLNQTGGFTIRIRLEDFQLAIC